MTHEIKHFRHIILGSARVLFSFECSCGFKGPRRQMKPTEMAEECRARVVKDAEKHLRRAS